MGTSARTERNCTQSGAHVTIECLQGAEVQFSIGLSSWNCGINLILASCDHGDRIGRRLNDSLDARADIHLPTNVGIGKLRDTGLIGFELGSKRSHEGAKALIQANLVAHALIDFGNVRILIRAIGINVKSARTAQIHH